MKKFIPSALLFTLSLFAAVHFAQSAEFSIGIMQDAPGAAREYGPLIELFEANGLDVKLKGYSSYTDAAVKFANGEVDSMFAGSGVAGTMMIKKVAYPVLRPVSAKGFSTYWAVIIAPQGSPPFTGDPSYFQDKKIICSALASSGEFFARSILGTDRELLTAASHGVAIDSLARNAADVAIVKNRVWDDLKSKYPELVAVGQDTGENPDNTLIVSYKTDRNLVARVEEVLFSLENNTSKEAAAVKESLHVARYIPTTEDDFRHTLALLGRAGVTPDFNFSY